MNSRKRSEALFKSAQERIPGGVDSPVRAFLSVGGSPYFVDRGQGSRIWDADGNEYLDSVLSWGPLILGHAHPRVVAALREAAARGTSYGAPTAAETELAELVQEAFPSMELLRFVNSGTEATMSAIRVARGFTKRNLIVKFEGVITVTPTACSSRRAAEELRWASPTARAFRRTMRGTLSRSPTTTPWLWRNCS